MSPTRGNQRKLVPWFSFPKVFGKEKREVHLNGEAYFKVLPDETRPFLVVANHAVIEVRGTEFNVRAWRRTGKVRVAVATGKVALSSKENDPGAEVLITKGHSSVLPDEGRPTEPVRDDIENHLGWIERKMFFDDAPLQEVLHQLERWHDVTFVVDKDIPPLSQITVQVKDASISATVKLIARIMGFSYRIEGRSIYLFSEKNGEN